MDSMVVAGCTAVVALLAGNQLYVANAGDSRGVLCRGAEAYALSYDHKPQQDKELGRISAAGVFVNFVGRINGNLNLSR
ncbi:phosphatase 2C-like domain-containing protein, partial [Ochromonadaceae sp. CCMP2298]